MDSTPVPTRIPSSSIFIYAILASVFQTVHWALLLLILVSHFSPDSDFSRIQQFSGILLIVPFYFAGAAVILLLIYLCGEFGIEDDVAKYERRRSQLGLAYIVVVAACLFLAVYIIFLIVTTLRLFERTFFARSDWCFSIQFLFGSCKLPPGCNTNSQFHAVSDNKNDPYFKRFNCRKNDTMTFNLVPFGLALLFIALIAFHTWSCVTFSTVVYEATKINQRCRRCGGWRCRQCAEEPFYGGANNEQTQFL